MTIIDRKPSDRKISDKCTECGCTLPRYHPHHFLCQKCWEKKEMEAGRAGYIAWADRKKMLTRGKKI